MQANKSSQYDIVSLQNIDSEDFYFEYDRSAGNSPYMIPAGEIKRFPRFLAEHALKHLIDKILTKRKARTNNESARVELASQIVIDQEIFKQANVKTEAEVLNDQITEINKPSDLDNVLAKAKEKAKQEAKKEPEVIVTTTTDSTEKFEGLAVEPTPGTTTTIEIEAKPTRGELYEYASKNGLVLDEPDKEGKTLKQRLEKMKIDEVIKEIDYNKEDNA